MTDWLSRMRLDSALPFGLLTSVVTLVAMVAVGTFAALRLRSNTLRTLAILATALTGARLLFGVASGVLLREDLNPRIEPGNLVGTWEDGRQRLLLRSDGTYQLVGPVNERGTWSLDDWNLRVGARTIRVITVNGVPRIVPEFPVDPDQWNGRLGFAKQAP